MSINSFFSGVFTYILSEIPTFIVAGHETTRYVHHGSSDTDSKSWCSVTMSWALYALSQNKEVQRKLREEIFNISTENPTMDDLNGLPYMDAVVRETLRLYPAVASILRQAGKDDCIPLSKPFTDKKGIVRNEIRYAFNSIFTICSKSFLDVDDILGLKRVNL